MSLDEGASHEINSRWPKYKQRNVGISFDFYGKSFAENMMCGIQVVRDHHKYLQDSGEKTWSMTQALSDTLDDLAQI